MLITACSSEQATLEPDQIVSITLCADSYILAMPELKTRYGAFSWQSDSTLSTLPEPLRGQYPQAGENREQLIRFGPATFVTGPATSPLSNPDIHLNWGEDFETVWENFAALSDGLGVADPSQNYIKRLEALPKLNTSPRILYLNRAGGTAGPNTFVDAVITAAGAKNLITTPSWQSPDTETLLQLDPDVIVTSFIHSDYAGIGDRLVRHEALAKKLADTPHINISGRFWPCAGPGLVDAAEYLSVELQKL